MKKKLLATLVSLTLLLAMVGSVFSLPVSAATSGGYAYTVFNGEATITDYSTSSSYGGDIVIPSALGGYPVTSIGTHAFSDCDSLTSVTIPDSVTRIGYDAFSRCTSLTSVTIPDSVTSIGDYAFFYCTSLTSVYITDVAAWCGINFSSSSSNPLSYAHIFYLNGELVTELTIPDSVTSIGDYTFYNCYRLTSVTIPDSVTSIGNSAFYDCDSLTSVTIPDSVTSIGNSAFCSCYSLTSINVDQNSTKYCSVDGVLFNKDKTTLIQYPAGKTLTAYSIPDSVTSIGDRAFYYCDSLTSVTIPDSVTSIGGAAFCSCYRLTSVTIPDSVTSIGSSAFEECTNLTSVTIPDSVTSIGGAAFNDCNKLTDVWYTGSETDRIAITIGSLNSCLKAAIWHYNTCADEHSFTNACDKSCNVCGATRTVAGHDYEKKVTKATTTKDGKIKHVCTKCGYTSSKVTTIYKASKVSLSKTSYTYNGKVQKPSVVVKDSKGKTISSKYYTVTYASGRKNVGKYKVTVKFKGNYSGTKTLYFTINPVKTTLGTLTAAKKALTVKWTKKAPQISGYQIQYSTTKSFKSYKTKTVSSYKTTSTKLTGLSAKKTYYVRIRTYKTVSGKKYYSGWSTVKYKKTK